jgi:hypothetical protein
MASANKQSSPAYRGLIEACIIERGTRALHPEGRSNRACDEGTMEGCVACCPVSN